MQPLRVYWRPPCRLYACAEDLLLSSMEHSLAVKILPHCPAGEVSCPAPPGNLQDSGEWRNLQELLSTLGTFGLREGFLARKGPQTRPSSVTIIESFRYKHLCRSFSELGPCPVPETPGTGELSLGFKTAIFSKSEAQKGGFFVLASYFSSFAAGLRREDGY